jgi:hypothetical protein
LPIPVCLSFSACPFLHFQFWLFPSAWPVLPVLYSVTRSECPFCLSRSSCPVLVALFRLSCFPCPDRISCFAYPVLSSIGRGFLKQLSAEVNGGAYIY